MEPMKPMQPMEPLKPLDHGNAWWPKELGSPASSGAQDGLRYAFFPDKKRLVVETDGTVRIYDSGDHRISGVRQVGGGTASFTDAGRTVDLSELKPIG